MKRRIFWRKTDFAPGRTGGAFRAQLTYGLPGVWARLLAAGLMGLLAANWLQSSASLLQKAGVVDSMPGFADVVLYLFAGMPVFDPAARQEFRVPALWFANQVVFLFLAARAPRAEEGRLGGQLLLRSGRRRIWWTKWISSMTMVLAGYLVQYGAILLAVLCKGGYRSFWIPTQGFSGWILGQSEVACPLGWCIYLYLVPILGSLLLAGVQLALAAAVPFSVSLVTVLVVLAASCYYFSPFLPGNYAMVCRSVLVLPHGVSVWPAAAVCLAGLTVAFFVGQRCFETMDLVPSKKEEMG